MVGDGQKISCEIYEPNLPIYPLAIHSRAYKTIPGVIAGAAVGQHHVNIAVRRQLVGELCVSAGRRCVGIPGSQVFLVTVGRIAEVCLLAN